MKLRHFQCPTIPFWYTLGLLFLPSSVLMISTSEASKTTPLFSTMKQHRDSHEIMNTTFLKQLPIVRQKRGIISEILGDLASGIKVFSFIQSFLEPGMEADLKPHMQELKSAMEYIRNDIKETNTHIANENIKTRYADAESNIHLSQETFLDYLNQPESEYLKDKFMENAAKLESSIRIFLEGLLGNYQLKGDIMKSARDYLNCRSKSLQSLMDSHSKMLLIGVVHHTAYCKLKNFTETEQSHFMRKFETSMDSIKIRLSKIIEACRDPVGVIPEMNRIGRENANTTSHQNVADELYSYLSDRFDTLQWAVFAHPSILMNEFHFFSLTNFMVRFGDRFSSFSHPLGVYYQSDCFLEYSIPWSEAISFPVNMTIPSLYDENALREFLKRSYLRKSDDFAGKLNFVAIDSFIVAIKFSPQIPYSRFYWTFEIDGHRTNGNNRRNRTHVVERERELLESNLFIFPASEIDDSNATNLITFVDPTNNNISEDYFPITNRYNKVVSVKGDYKKGWQWVWQENYQIGRLGQLWKYTKDHQLVNKLGMSLEIYRKRTRDPFYVIQSKCAESDGNQIWNIASNGNIFHAYHGCLESYYNAAGGKDWLVVSKEACFRNPAGSETWTFSN